MAWPNLSIPEVFARSGGKLTLSRVESTRITKVQMAAGKNQIRFFNLKDKMQGLIILVGECPHFFIQPAPDKQQHPSNPLILKDQ